MSNFIGFFIGFVLLHIIWLTISKLLKCGLDMIWRTKRQPRTAITQEQNEMFDQFIAELQQSNK